MNDSSDMDSLHTMMGSTDSMISYRTNMINNQFMSDIVLIVGTGDAKQRVFCHKLFLISASKYFATMFSSSFKETSMNEITLEDTDSTCFSEILRFVYSTRMNITLENVQEICKLSERYLFPDVLVHASEFLLKSVTEKNVLRILQLNRRCKFENVDARCLDIITRNPILYFKEESITSLDPDSLELIFKARRINCSDYQLLEVLEKWKKDGDVDLIQSKAKAETNLKAIIENTPRSVRCNTLHVFGSLSNDDNELDYHKSCMDFRINSKNPIFLLGLGMYFKSKLKKFSVCAKISTCDYFHSFSRFGNIQHVVTASGEFSTENSDTANILDVFLPCTKLLPQQCYRITSSQDAVSLDAASCMHDEIKVEFDQDRSFLAYFLYMDCND
ncbi:kelch repeat and BTB domain-containing protein 8-like [Malaya genurostris]|uniref:kelch repeat and BTB domain-containing protein 8-like n=1 Tax=Malaya genurostris TaxID=325434 RepID=UPI0026F39147|nr:kelch repeat and BTB domain-containing protein 8-like [Malaya genurostris]